MYVLVVDDSMTMRRIVVDSLRAITDAEVIEVDSGEEALSILRSNAEVRAVLLDWHLPGMSGLEVIRAMQADPDLARIPAVMVTAEREKQNVITALRMGAKNYIVKPFAQSVFRRKVGPIVSAPAEDAPAPRPAGSLVGNLEQTSPLEVIQLISITRKTGVLGFDSPDGAYSLYFTDGQIDHAEGESASGERTEGEDAVGAAGRISGGTFTFRAEVREHAVTVRRSTDMILLEQFSRPAGK